MINIGIFGSCVSRDIFRITQNEINIEYYIARSSLVSAVSKPLNILEEEISLNSPFQKRLVTYDFNKTFLKEIINSKVDYLILDFIDERLNLLKHDESYVTRSVELVNSNIEENHNYSFKLIKRNSNDALFLWEKACKLFIEELKKKFSSEQIILHKAYWLAKYKDENKICNFEENMMRQINASNKLLEHYYSYFEKHWEGINSISLDNDSYFADKQHQWGLSPFHYEEEYYRQVSHHINSIMNICKNRI